MTLWNWKTALWSGLYRAPAFFAVTLKSGGLGAAAKAGAIEFALFATVAGFTGALTQRVRHLEPAWLRALIVAIGIPALLHSSEWLVHGLAGTPARKTGVLVSICMTVVAELFNFYAMRRGLLLAGREGGGFWSDVRQLPAVVLGFTTWPFRVAARYLREVGQ